MDYILEKEVLILKPTGEITSSNAIEVEASIEDIIKNNKFDKLILDFLELNYTSSAGLRVILRLKQKYKNVSIINGNSNVYDILEMTGFTNILDVKTDFDFVTTNVSISFFDEYIYRRLELNL